MPKPDQLATLGDMGELVSLIQQYLDKHQVRWAAFARNIGTIPQTVQKWKANPQTFPSPQHLREVARVTGVPYLLVLDAVLKDAGYRNSLVDDVETIQVRLARAVRKSDTLVFKLVEFLERSELPDDNDMNALGLHAGMTSSDIDRAAEKFCGFVDKAAGYGHEPMVHLDEVRERLSDYISELGSVDDGIPDELKDFPDGLPPGWRLPSGEEPGVDGVEDGDERDDDVGG